MPPLPTLRLHRRIASTADLPAGKRGHTITELQRGFLGDAESADRADGGLDVQLVADRTYFIVEADGMLAACGDRNPRTTLRGFRVKCG
jgi:hypothetical protein